MTTKVAFFRSSSVLQLSAVNGLSCAADERTYMYYTLCTTGWSTGNRTRMKNFSCVDDCLAYLNKLNAGEWMSDEAYDHGYTMVNAFKGSYMCINGDEYRQPLEKSDQTRRFDDSVCKDFRLGDSTYHLKYHSDSDEGVTSLK